MSGYLYSNIVENFIVGSSNSLVLPSNMSKIDVELLVDHVRDMLGKNQDKQITDKCKNLLTILKAKVE